jgi:hypothetical protein
MAIYLRRKVRFAWLELRRVTWPARAWTREVLREFRNLYYRIGILSRNKLYRYRRPFSLPLPWAPGTVRLPKTDKLTRARIVSMRQLLAIHPAATRVDMYLVTMSLHIPGLRQDEQKPSEGAAGQSSDTPQSDTPHKENCIRTGSRFYEANFPSAITFTGKGNWSIK